jgi:FkbM family methyltransferase
VPLDLASLLEATPERRPIPADAPVVVYGAGNMGRAILDRLRRRGYDVRAFLDRQGGNGRQLDGLPVYAPSDDGLDAEERCRAVAVVAVFNRDANVAEIHDLLGRAGYARVVGFVELHDLLGDMPEFYWLGARDVYGARVQEIRLGASRWHDAPSRALYERVVAYRLTGDPRHAPHPADGLQYFPRDVPRRREPLRYIDCGAYTGDSLAAATAAGERFEIVCAFEPDPANFSGLVQRAGAVAPGARVQLWPCAVAGTTGTLRFASGAGESSHVTSAGDLVVQAVRLDDVLPSFDATDLKMDIEGAEPEALAGAVQLIQRNRPRLAVCVYHRADHLWSIPAAVEALDLDYDFFLRSHGNGGFDVVMYGIPREQVTEGMA